MEGGRDGGKAGERGVYLTNLFNSGGHLGR